MLPPHFSRPSYTPAQYIVSPLDYAEADLKDPSMVLTLLQLSELKSLCKQLHMPAAVVASSKAKMIQALFKQDRDHRPLFGRAQFMSSVVKR